MTALALALPAGATYAVSTSAASLLTRNGSAIASIAAILPPVTLKPMVRAKIKPGNTADVERVAKARTGSSDHGQRRTALSG